MRRYSTTPRKECDAPRLASGGTYSQSFFFRPKGAATGKEHSTKPHNLDLQQLLIGKKAIKIWGMRARQAHKEKWEQNRMDATMRTMQNAKSVYSTQKPTMFRHVWYVLKGVGCKFLVFGCFQTQKGGFASRVVLLQPRPKHSWHSSCVHSALHPRPTLPTLAPCMCHLRVIDTTLAAYGVASCVPCCR